jgi:hypothetical protein
LSDLSAWVSDIDSPTDGPALSGGPAPGSVGTCGVGVVSGAGVEGAAGAVVSLSCPRASPQPLPLPGPLPPAGHADWPSEPPEPVGGVPVEVEGDVDPLAPGDSGGVLAGGPAGVSGGVGVATGGVVSGGVVAGGFDFGFLRGVVSGGAAALPASSVPEPDGTTGESSRGCFVGFAAIELPAEDDEPDDPPLGTNDVPTSRRPDSLVAGTVAGVAALDDGVAARSSDERVGVGLASLVTAFTPS